MPAARRRFTNALLLGFLALPPSFSTGLTAQELDVDVSGLGYVLGDPTAPVEVVEFGDFACSACGEFWRDTWPEMKRELIETGRVSWRHIPFLLGFDRGDDGANAAECAADQGEFWTMHDRLFEGQSEWLRVRRPKEAFLRYAHEVGLDVEEFEDCYDDERGEDRTRDATRAAHRVSVRGTPTFFINGRPAFGALPFEMFLGLIEEEERRAGSR
jgi:protein-disulfide isomerase